MLILGISSTILYLVLGVRYAYALGVLTGPAQHHPHSGRGSLDCPGHAGCGDGFLGPCSRRPRDLYVVYLQVENSFLVPRIMKRRVGLPSLAILVALLLGSELGGIVGAMISVPTAVLVAELVNEYLVHKDPA